MILSFKIYWMLADMGISGCIIYKAFQQMSIPKGCLKLMNNFLVELVSHRVTLLGTIFMTLMVGQKPKYERIEANWWVVDCKAFYNVIISRFSLATLKVAISPPPTINEIFQLSKSDRNKASDCGQRMLHFLFASKAPRHDESGPSERKIKPESSKPLEEVMLNDEL